ncbi:MAG: uL15 family ribosomal protein [Candidatus Pacearchaeota archaeon]|nr:uL15 family ribosomal protein [Candidatus Pacearchaeota archaeon]
MRRKRSKRSRLRGKRTCGYGHKFKHRGKGSKGGKGMAGTGKMAGHKKTFVLRYMPNYFGRRGFKSKKKKPKTITLEEINQKLNEFLEKGIAKEKNGCIEIELKNYKVLGTGSLGPGFIVKASNFSKKATEKISEAGSKAEIIK